MKTTIRWNQAMNFTGESEKHSVVMDAKSPIGRGEGLTPKELVAIGLAGCTAMDVAAWMKKNKQIVDHFEIQTEIETTTSGHPAVFTKAVLHFRLSGNIQKEILTEAVQLSQTKYCGVSAMLSKSFPIIYSVELNGEMITQGEAKFD
jgi:putative redox protein